jgi:hypothetical protein
MDIAKLIASVAVVTEIIKKLLLKIHIELKGQAAVVLAVIVSAGVVVVESLMIGQPLGLSTIVVFIKVVLGATIGYAIVTKSSETKSKTGE